MPRILECNIYDNRSGLLIETINLLSQPKAGDRVTVEDCIYHVISVKPATDGSDYDLFVNFL